MEQATNEFSRALGCILCYDCSANTYLMFNDCHKKVANITGYSVYNSSDRFSSILLF